MPLDLTEQFAKDLDRQDPLKRYREEFLIAEPGTIYLDGNSLGRLPLGTSREMEKRISREWGERLIRGWNEGWMELPSRLGAGIARLIGAQSDEVLVCDATSVNLFKLVMAALKYQKGRFRIISDELNFPSDLYVLQGITDLMGPPWELQVIQSEDTISIEPEAIQKAVDRKTALLSFTHTYFKSSFIQDMDRVTRMAHEQGALVLWDLSHSVGSVPVRLNDCNADLAVGCTYKYLNGGPGSPAFLYVRKDLQEKLQQPIWGWLGSRDPFSFGTDYEPAGDMKRFMVGTPPVLSMSAVETGLNLLLNAGMDELRNKSLRQSEYMIQLFDTWLAPLGFSLGSPRDPARRGSHIAIQHPDAEKITRALIMADSTALRVIPDFRTPDNIRLGIAPIYNSFQDIFLAMQRIRVVTESKEYLKY